MGKNASWHPLGTGALALVALCLGGSHATAQQGGKSAATYARATSGLVEFQSPAGSGGVEHWKLLLDASNLGGKELEMAELILPAGEVVRSHHHGSVEVIYVLSGTLGHEVNGEMHTLTPGMVGVVRPEDAVRHIVGKEGDARILVIWAPGGEAQKYFGRAKTTPVGQK